MRLAPESMKVPDPERKLSPEARLPLTQATVPVEPAVALGFCIAGEDILRGGMRVPLGAALASPGGREPSGVDGRAIFCAARHLCYGSAWPIRAPNTH